MRRLLAAVTVALLSMSSACPALGQRARAGPATIPEQAAHLRRSAASPGPAGLYQPRDTWYEFALKQFNPDDVDYGTWMELHRDALLDASVRNPYFKYSATVTIGLLLVALLCTKQWIDHRRSMWITAEMMTDLYNHDVYSRQVARDAIQKYNDHIERCNRAVEAAEHGLPVGGTDSDVDRFRLELQAVAAERDSYRRERDLVKSELAEKARLLADLSLRLDALAKKSGSNRDAASAADVRTADQKLVQHINNLQERLHAEKRENMRLKGA